MKIVVFGAGGEIGGRIVNEALGRDHRVTAVYRSGRGPFADGRSVVRGDARDPVPILRETEPDVVISAVGAGAPGPAPDYDVYADVAEAFVDELGRLGEAAPRLLAVGGAGSLNASPGLLVIDTPQFPEEFREEALAQARALDIYRDSVDVRWTYVSPAAQIEPGERTGAFRTGTDDLLVDEDGHSRITMEDYAMALLDEVERPKSIGRRMTVAY